jgi:hypothetical protein
MIQFPASGSNVWPRGKCAPSSRGAKLRRFLVAVASGDIGIGGFVNSLPRRGFLLLSSGETRRMQRPTASRRERESSNVFRDAAFGDSFPNFVSPSGGAPSLARLSIADGERRSPGNSCRRFSGDQSNSGARIVSPLARLEPASPF